MTHDLRTWLLAFACLDLALLSLHPACRPAWVRCWRALRGEP